MPLAGTGKAVRRMTVCLPEQLFAEVVEFARTNEVTITAVIVKAVEVLMAEGEGE